MRTNQHASRLHERVGSTDGRENSSERRRATSPPTFLCAPTAGGALAIRMTIVAVLMAGIAAGCSRTSDAREPTVPEAAYAAASLASHAAPHDPGGIEWGPAPAIFPPGAELAVLQGTPSEPGAVFTLRLRMPNGYVFPPHFHPEDEHVTVVQGRFMVGLGNVVDEESALASLGRDGFITAPKLHNHWAIARGQTVVQVHGIGPFQTTFVDEQGHPLPE